MTQPGRGDPHDQLSTEDKALLAAARAAVALARVVWGIVTAPPEEPDAGTDARFTDAQDD